MVAFSGANSNSGSLNGEWAAPEGGSGVNFFLQIWAGSWEGEEGEVVQTGVNKKLFVNEILPGQEFKISILGGNIHLKIAFGQKLTKNLLTYFTTWL